MSFLRPFLAFAATSSNIFHIDILDNASVELSIPESNMETENNMECVNAESEYVQNIIIEDIVHEETYSQVTNDIPITHFTQVPVLHSTPTNTMSTKGKTNRKRKSEESNC